MEFQKRKHINCAAGGSHRWQDLHRLGSSPTCVRFDRNLDTSASRFEFVMAVKSHTATFWVPVPWSVAGGY